MNRTWEIWLDEPNGKRIKILDEIISFSLVRNTNNIGAFTITLPGNFDESLLRIDNIIEFWRNPDGWELVGFIRKKIYTVDNNGSDIVIVTGVDCNDLLKRRIIAYAANSSQSAKTDYADDMMKDIVRENLGSSATGSRNLTSVNFTVAIDTSNAPSITKSFAWKKLFDVLKEIADSSETSGTRLYFTCVPQFVNDNQIGFQFKTYINQPGVDRTGTAYVIFGKEWGNLENPSLEYNYTDEQNYIYAGGQGDEANRQIVEVSDSDRINLSIWNRREGFEDARNESTTAGVTAKGNAALNENKPLFKFNGNLLDTPFSQYGIDWNWGDKVVLTYRGIQLSGIINVVQISVNEDGVEDIKAKFEVVS